MLSLNQEDLLRYQRQISLAEFGEAGQRRLKQARVLIVGAGGLGSPAATYLAAAGVGTIGLVDHDRVDISNLHRQPLHGTSDVGRSKLASAMERLHSLNPLVHIELHDEWFTSSNAISIANNYDIIIDGTDNFSTRYLVNDVCVLQQKPNIYGSVFRFDGQASVFCVPGAPCYRCLYPTPPPPASIPNCAEGGVLGVLPGIIGTIQATEAIKLLAGIGKTLAGRLLMVDALYMRFHSIAINANPNCPACGTRTITSLVDYDAFCGEARSTQTQDNATAVVEINADTLLAWQNSADTTSGAPLLVIDVREPSETATGVIPGSQLIPLGNLKQAMSNLPRDHRIVVLCASGVRSAAACRWLIDAGFPNVFSLAGGMRQMSGKPLSSNT